MKNNHNFSYVFAIDDAIELVRILRHSDNQPHFLNQKLLIDLEKFIYQHISIAEAEALLNEK